MSVTVLRRLSAHFVRPFASSRFVSSRFVRRLNISVLLSLVGLWAAAGGLLAQAAAQDSAQASAPPSTANPVPKPCTAEEYRQLDFWLGTWKVQNQLQPDRPASTNRITAVEDGCVISERYTTQVGYTGRSLSFYDVARKKWHQTWIDNRGQALYLDGAFEDGALVLFGEARNGGRHRITWRPLDGGKVQQLWETSKDGGTTWTTAFDGLYTPMGE